MRTLVAFAFLAVCLGSAAANEPKPAKSDEKKEKILRVGDEAPALLVKKWVQGPEVKTFESNKVYVVAFGDWCRLPPCPESYMIPHSDLNDPNAAKGLKAFSEFQMRHPKLASTPYFTAPRLKLLLKAEKLKEAHDYAQESIVKAVRQDDAAALLDVSVILRSTAAKNDKGLHSLSLGAATAVSKIAGNDDAFAELNLAQTYKAMGYHGIANVYGEKALAATAGESEPLTNYIKQQVEELKK